MFSTSPLLSVYLRGAAAAGRTSRSGLGGLGRRTLVNAASLAVKDVSLTECRPLEGGRSVALGFSDGTKFQFSGLWLRDSCRNPSLVCEAAGERILDKIPFSTGGRGIVAEAKVASTSAEKLEVNWADESDVVSTFDAGFLRQYAEAVAKDLAKDPDDCYAKDGGKSEHAASDRWRWLQPYQGFAGSKAPVQGEVDLWKNEQREAGDQFLHWDFNELVSSDEANLAFLQALVRHGVCIVDDVVPTPEKPNDTVLNFASTVLGGMQKDPARDDPNWVIQAKDNAQSVSYAQLKRLNNHTDQSVPAHGIPALVLCVDYVRGVGRNTLVDSYAVGEALKERDPRAYALLAKYGNNQERDFVSSRVDSVQQGTQGMLIATKHPIIQLDEDGKHLRTQFNEVFRTPSTIPYEDFEDWYDAYLKFNDMIHGPEFEVEVAINQGQMLVLNNWRVLHGRAGGRSSPDRCIMGGTVVREAFCSRATNLLGATYPVQDFAARS
jgi:alpha-ketoglutarate-dependent taurine dioxygenase